MEKRFQEAKDLKAQADALEADEARIAASRARGEFKKKTQALVLRQQRELELFESHRERGFEFIIGEEEKVISRYGKMIEKAERQLEILEEKPSRLEKRLAEVEPLSPEEKNRLRPFVSDPRLNLNGLVLKRYCRVKREATGYSVTRHQRR
jgi:hypothetical protein